MSLPNPFRGHDSSTNSLIVTNLFVILLAVCEDWNISTILWVYWAQSVIIGAVNVIRILTVKNLLTTEKEQKNSIKVSEVVGLPVKAFMAGFFAIHYGLFHFGYAAFLSIIEKTADMKYVFLVSVLFFINHTYSFMKNNLRDSKKQDFGRIFMYPYQRIIPMHLTIIFGSAIFMFGFPEGNRLVVILFLGLKAMVDVKAHISEHG